MSDRPGDMTDDDQLGARLQALHTRYADALPDRLREIVQAAAPTLGPGHHPEAATDAARFAHNLAGTGETFGYGVLGLAARAVEDELRAYRDRTRPPTPAERHALRAALTDLLTAAHSAGVRDLPALPS